MGKPVISAEVRLEATAIVEAFNAKVYKGSADLYYIPRFQGSFLYLDRKEYRNTSPVARLKYTGDINKWEFAIFKWSRETYDPDERFFPGAEFLNGTIEGAMKAGIEAYPV